MDFQIEEPAKNEFKFNEVISLTSVKPYVLRFWETEFIQINPSQDNNGEKIYSKNDILVIKTIKKLLFTDKMSIPEAKGMLDKEIESIQAQDVSSEVEEKIVDIKGQSKDLKLALEEIINAHSIVPNSSQVNEQPIVESSNKEVEEVEVSEVVEEKIAEPKSQRSYAQKSSSLAQKLKLDFKYHNRELSNQDIVNLVNSKKKLAKLLGQIEDLESKYNWA